MCFNKPGISSGHLHEYTAVKQLKALVQRAIVFTSRLVLGTRVNVGLEEWELIWSSIPWSSSSRRVDNSTNSLAHILSFIFWGTIKSSGLDWAVASAAGLPGSCGGREEAAMVLDISTLEEEGVDCCRLLVEAGTTEGTGREPEGNVLVAEEVDGIGPSEATCIGADRPGSNIAKALATPISTPLAILVDISSSNFLGSRPITGAAS